MVAGHSATPYDTPARPPKVSATHVLLFASTKRGPPALMRNGTCAGMETAKKKFVKTLRRFNMLAMWCGGCGLGL